MKPRPKIDDEEIITEAASRLAVMVTEWCNETPITLIDDIKKAIRYHSDGYEVAKELDHYSPDAGLVEILDETLSYKSYALIKACIAWVIETGITAPDIGAKVFLDGIEGTVIKNYPDGRALVNGTSARIVNWENLK